MRILSTLMLALALACLVLGACAPQDPEERLLEIRSRYTVKLNTWLPKEDLAPDPVPVDAAAVIDDEVMAGDGTEGDAMGDEAAEGEMAGDAMAGDEMAGDEMEGEAGEMMAGEEMAMEPVGPQPTSILFDLVVRFEGDEPLPGITVDITHADSNETVKDTRRHWIDTSDLVSGVSEQKDFVLDGFLLEEGDIFSVELRQVIPPAERSAYRELAGLGS